jgi:hypothetical protein
LALEIGVCSEFGIPTGTPVCDGSEPVCACAKLSELICISFLIYRNSACNSFFLKGTENFGMSVLEGVKLQRVSALGADKSVRTSPEDFEICSVQTAEMLRFSSLRGVEIC